MPISPETQSKLEYYRRREADGSITIEEMREVVRLLRSDRLNAATAAAASGRKSTRKTSASTESLLSELGNL